jgi:hypothetical protein
MTFRRILAAPMKTCLNKIELCSAKQLALGEIVLGDLTVTFAIAGRF